MKKKWTNLLFILAVALGVCLPMTTAHAEDYADDYDYYVNCDWEDEDTEWICLSEYYGDWEAEEIIIPEEIDGLPVCELDYGLFMDMENLKTVTMPATVKIINASCFEGTSLTTINIQSDVEYEIWEDAFKGTPWYDALVEEAQGAPIVIGTTIYDMNECTGDVVIPDGVTKIAWSAWDRFYNDDTYKYETQITSFTIPASLKELGVEEAISSSPVLENVTVEAGNEIYFSKDGVLYSIEEDVDNENEYLTYLLAYPAQKTATSFAVPAEVDVISGVHNKKLKKVTFAGDKIVLTGGAFADCTNLSTVTLPDEVFLSSGVFSGTAVKSIKLPAKCEMNVGSSGTPFTGMSKLEKITVDSANKDFKVVNGALCSYEESDWKFVVCYPAAKSGTTFIIPTGMKGAYSLDEAKNLTTIVVPKSVESIYATNSKMTKVNTIKYLGTKTQWKKVFFGNPFSGAFTVKNMYYNCKSISSAKATIAKSSYTYTGKAIKPTVTVKLSGKKLTSSNYSVAYKNNTATGKATITITGKGSYYGTVTKTFKIVPKQIKNVKATSPAKRQLKVTWSKNTTADGYAVQYATNSKVTKGLKTVYVKSNATSSTTIKSLTKGKTYYVRVRAYKIIDGVKCYGTYSTKKSVKIK